MYEYLELHTNHEVPHYAIFSCIPLIPHTSNIFFNILLSNTLCLHPYLNAKDHVSHPHKTTGKIIVLYILAFTYLDSKWEDTRFLATEHTFLEFNLPLISSSTQLLFVTIILKYR